MQQAAKISMTYYEGPGDHMGYAESEANMHAIAFK